MAASPTKRKKIGTLALVIVLILRVSASYASPITDCDETFNYWEPAHYLLYGSGKQTWEYANQFALRSWAYLWLYVWPAKVILMLYPHVPKPFLFYMTKAGVAAVCAFSEWFAARGIAWRFGHRAGATFLLASVASAGVALASPAFLPSSFAMVMNYLALGAWARADAQSAMALPKRSAFWTFAAVLASASGAILGWPFAALVSLPIAMDLVSRRSGWDLARLVAGSFGLIGGLLSVVFAFDTAYYCRPALSAFELVKYNVFGGEGRGPELYGVEPWHFFFRNLSLNFGPLFAVALVSPCIFLWSGTRARGAPRLTARGSPGAACKFVAPFFLWFAFWLRIPHKEERFMAPAYPFLVVAASLAAATFAEDPKMKEDDSAKLRDHQHGRFRRLSLGLFLAIALFVGASRFTAMVKFYGGPEVSAASMYTMINESLAQSTTRAANRNLTVCVGRDWFRFPSSFFIPEGATYTFAKTSFTGALPLDFRAEAGGSCAATPDFNDLNQEVAGQSVPADQLSEVCSFYVDSTVAGVVTEIPLRIVDGDGNPLTDTTKATTRMEPGFTPVSELSQPLLDPSRTKAICRIGYVPVATERCARYGEYFVLKRQ